MTPLVLGLALLSAEPSHVITLSEREPFAFILNTPTGAVANTGSSEIIRQVSDLLRRDTSFQLQEIEAAVVETCRGQLTCLVRAVRRDYERAALTRAGGGVLPYREHVHRLKEDGRAYPRYVLLLSNVTVADRPDRLTALLLDTDVALEIFHGADRTVATWKDDVEAEIGTNATRGAPVRQEIRDPHEARRFLEDLFRRTYAGVFDETGHWMPYGEVDIDAKVGDLEIVLDGTSVGTTQVGVTRLTRALPGTRALVLRHPDYETFETVVTIRKGEAVMVTVDPERVAAAPIARTAVLWTGVALAAAGIGLTGWAITRADGDVRTVCFGDAVCEGNRFVSSTYDPMAPFLEPDMANSGGVPLAPLGLALVGAGAGFSLGVLFTDDDTSPWWGVLAGALAGGTIFAVSVAAN
jgi:hypothetical protein